MSYTPNTWQGGDTITAAKLNSMESGINSAVNAFVVNLTPTGMDYSGTMDKTIAEIYAAYQAGQRIVYRVWMGEGTYTDVEVTMVYTNASYAYPSFNAFIIDETNNLLVEAATGATDDGTKDQYYTNVYPLTLMGE